MKHHIKQHITVEQLWEIAKNQEDWDSITDYNTFANIKFIGNERSFSGCCKVTAEQTNIGKMIEIIYNKDPHIEIFSPDDDRTEYEDEWVVYSSHYFSSASNNLCDALWEDVKEIYKKQQNAKFVAEIIKEIEETGLDNVKVKYGLVKQYEK